MVAYSEKRKEENRVRALAILGWLSVMVAAMLSQAYSAGGGYQGFPAQKWAAIMCAQSSGASGGEADDLDNWKAEIDAKMSAYAQQYPDDALPHYWAALRYYEKGEPEAAVSAVLVALQKPCMKLPAYPTFEDRPSSYMTPSKVVALVHLQTEYAERLASKGNRESALNVLQLLDSIANQAMESVKTCNSRFITAALIWKQAMQGRAKLLKAIGEEALSIEACNKVEKMNLFLTKKVEPSMDVFAPLIRKAEAFVGRKDISEGKKEQFGKFIEKVYENAKIRQDRLLLLLWKKELSSLQRDTAGK